MPKLPSVTKNKDSPQKDYLQNCNMPIYRDKYYIEVVLKKQAMSCSASENQGWSLSAKKNYTVYPQFLLIRV